MAHRVGAALVGGARRGHGAGRGAGVPPQRGGGALAGQPVHHPGLLRAHRTGDPVHAVVPRLGAGLPPPR